MYKISRAIFLILILSLFAVVGVYSQDNKKPEGKEGKKPARTEVKENLKETTHEIVINGKKIEYKAIAGTMPLKIDTKDATAEIFFIAYFRTDAGDLAGRPITFSFNGGPGSSSVWLHMGLLGPRRVLMTPEGDALPPPYELIDNEYSLIDKTDLVFIDPVSTGFSRAVEGEDPKQFHGVDEDISSVGEFIRLCLTRYERWSSPKFLIGESYGTLRAAGLSDYLQGRHGMYLNGIMLVSSILQFQTARFSAGNDLPYILFLPTYTATAWYHKQLDGELQADLKATLQQVEEFALGEYATALLKGDNLPDEKCNEIVAKLARFTGLSEEYVRQTNMRIMIYRFVKELLRDEHRTVGRLDSRFKGIDSDAAGEGVDYDPSYDAVILGPYSTTFNDYVRRELKFESELSYEILTGRVRPWSYKRYQNRYVNTAERLRSAMTKNPYLKVFVANGYYDLATPYFATQYTFNHLGLDKSLRDNVTMGFYEAGHMMYIREASLAKLRGDLIEFLEIAANRGE
ncbi:MAG: peptidase S10 [candidate division Zixibacteria bacterium]